VSLVGVLFVGKSVLIVECPDCLEENEFKFESDMKVGIYYMDEHADELSEKAIEALSAKRSSCSRCEREISLKRKLTLSVN
jgi:hypothetical protein